MLLHVLLCAALTVLLLIFGWCAAAYCLLPMQGKQIYMIVSAAGDGGSLEQQCRAYLLLRRFGFLRRPLLLIDAGMTGQGRVLAEKLTELDESILLCSPEELQHILQNEG